MSTHLYSKRKVCNLIFLGYKLIIRGCCNCADTVGTIEQIGVESNTYASMTEKEILAKLKKSREEKMFRDEDAPPLPLSQIYGKINT